MSNLAMFDNVDVLLACIADCKKKRSLEKM